MLQNNLLLIVECYNTSWESANISTRILTDKNFEISGYNHRVNYLVYGIFFEPLRSLGKKTHSTSVPIYSYLINILHKLYASSFCVFFDTIWYCRWFTMYVTRSLLCSYIPENSSVYSTRHIRCVTSWDPDTQRSMKQYNIRVYGCTYNMQYNII